MRLVHLTDLHFGRRVSQARLSALEADLADPAPELIILSGDITDRGSISQFRWARRFLDSLGVPCISVPGNREIAAGAFWEWMFPRFAMTRYSRFFGPSDRVAYRWEDPPILFLGINSVHSFPSWPGSIRRETRYWLRDISLEHNGHVKVLFLHHPVLPVVRSSSFWAHALSDAGEVLNIATETGISLILQGHKHRSSVMEITFPERNTKVIAASGGAPLMEGWDAAYHIIDILPTETVITPREYNGSGFAGTRSYRFSRMDSASDSSGPAILTLVR